MEFTQEQLKQTAKLSKIALTNQELDKFQPQMQSIVDSVKTLQELDTTGVVPSSHLSITFDKLRADVIKPSQSVEDALKNAPYREENYVMVKGSTFGSEGE